MSGHEKRSVKKDGQTQKSNKFNWLQNLPLQRQGQGYVQGYVQGENKA